MDSNALFNLTYGLYLLTARYDNRDNGCIINTVMQVTDAPARLSIVVNKQNYTHEMLSHTDNFNISVLTTEAPFELFEKFGFHSGRDTDKFVDCNYVQRADNQVLYLTQHSNAVLVCSIVERSDLGTHTQFLADITGAEVLSSAESVSYRYYQQHIKPQPVVSKGCWVCSLCGWVYEGENLPDDIVCPLCKHGKDAFEYVAANATSAPTSPTLSLNENTQNHNLMNQINQQAQITLAESIYYVGVNDRRTEKFEGHIEIPNGVSYNSYLIVDEKVVLIDPVEPSFMCQYLQTIKSIIGDRAVDYIVVNHAEPDHSGALAAVIGAYPNITVIGNEKTFAPIENFYGPITNKMIVKDGETLSLGAHTLQFFTAPMCHWPESMVTFEQHTGIIFSNDAFGGFGTLNGAIFDDEVNLDFYEEDMRRYYANIVGKVAMMAMKAIQKVAPLPIKMIAPSHGLVWRSNLNWVIERYSQWSSHITKPGVVIAYGSMYGNTAQMADIIARGVAASGVREIKVYDVSKTDSSLIMSDIWKYKGVILGGSSHYGSIIPCMVPLMHEISEYKPKNRVFGLFGGGSWSGGALKTLQCRAECSQWEVAAECVEVMGAPYKPEDIARLFALGKSIGQAVLDQCSE